MNGLRQDLTAMGAANLPDLSALMNQSSQIRLDAPDLTSLRQRRMERTRAMLQVICDVTMI